MSTVPISSSDEISYDPWRDEDRGEIVELAQKTQSIWAHIYDATVGNFLKIIPVLRSSIGSVVRDAFFFPLKWSPIADRQAVRDQLQVEEAYCRDFWDPEKPLDPNFIEQARIREKFAPPEDRTFSIQLKDGKTVEITCRIIETKAGGEGYYNFVQVPGIYATINNTVGTSYPYLAAYLNSEKEDIPLPPARFIVISENNLNYKPATLDEAGFVLLETLKALRAEFGEIDQLVAHSLGNVFITNVLKQVDDPMILPKHICLDRGPASIWEASKKYFWGLGRLIYYLAEFGGWASDLEQDIIDFCQKWKERPSLVITGVEQDHHFSGSANLCLSEKIKKIQGIEVLVFAPPRQIINEFGQHNMRADFLNPRYLIEESDFIEGSENFSEAIVRHSLPLVEVQQQSA